MQASDEQRGCDDLDGRSRARFRLVVMASNDAIFDWDFSNGRVWWNQSKRYVETFGAPPSPGIEWWRARVHPDEAEKILASRLAALARHQRDWQAEYRFRRADGTYADMAIRGQFTYDPDGTPIRMVGAITDVSLQKRTERELQSSLSFLKAALESTADGILVVDRNAQIALHNATFREMWGIPEALLAVTDDEPVLAFVTQQLKDPAAFLARVRELYRDPNAVSFDVLELRDGRIFERYSQPQRLGPTIVGRVWSFRDVTERNRAAESLRIRTAERQAILDNVVDAVFACDSERQIFLMNKAAQQLIGIGNQHAISINEMLETLSMRSSDGRRLLDDEHFLARALRGEIVHDTDALVDSAQRGTRFLRSSASPIRDENGRVVAAVAVCHDVTDFEELGNLKDEFVRVAAHELKTPVAVMKSYAQLALRESPELSPPLSKMLKAIDRGASRIDDIVRKLLDISQLLVGSLPLAKDKVNLGDLVESVVNRMGARLPPHRIRLHVVQSVAVYGDHERLAEVLEFLVDNAIRYSPNGGNVDVSLSATESEAVIAVEDRGVGIPQSKQDRIFERFYRAHSGTPYDYGGIGVGLFIASAIVGQHAGRISFQSKEGAGSTFQVRLPLPGVSVGGGD